MALTAADVVGSLARWKVNVLGQLSRILDAAITTGEAAASVAQRLRDYTAPLFAPRRNVAGAIVRPATSSLADTFPARPGMASAQPRRLMMVAVNEAHRDAVIATAGAGDFGVLWILSVEHFKHDVCDRLAEEDVGLGRGIYPPDRVPMRPHFGCQCITALIPLIAARTAA